MMNLKKFKLEDLLLAALKSETESKAIYTMIASSVKNGLLQDKFLFLAKEEEKHRQFVEHLFITRFPKKKLVIPTTTPVPLPALTIPEEDTPLGTILQTAMRSEEAAYEFYQSLSQEFIREPAVKNTLSYFADMELQHYKILEMEKKSMDRFEESDVYWPMVHAGP